MDIHVACRHVDTYMQLLDKVATNCTKDFKQDKMCGCSTPQAAGDRAAKAHGKLLTGRMLMSCSHMSSEDDQHASQVWQRAICLPKYHDVM